MGSEPQGTEPLTADTAPPPSSPTAVSSPGWGSHHFGSPLKPTESRPPEIPHPRPEGAGRKRERGAGRRGWKTPPTPEWEIGSPPPPAGPLPRASRCLLSPSPCGGKGLPQSPALPAPPSPRARPAWFTKLQSAAPRRAGSGLGLGQAGLPVHAGHSQLRQREAPAPHRSPAHLLQGAPSPRPQPQDRVL